MNINELMNLDISDVQRMTRRELAKAVSTLGSAANKRIKRFETKGIETPALRGVKRSGGNISTKGKTVNELRAEYVRAKTFLGAKTSTVKGYKTVQKQFEERIGGKLSEDETKTFWSAYNKLSELEPNFLKLYGSDRMQQYLRDEMTQHPGSESEDLAKMGKNRLEEMYRQIEEEYNSKEGGISGLSDFFELGEDL
jgi:hypothetical protein